ncbi:hypothetical protein M8494_13750 [Serratia ureilytica]
MGSNRPSAITYLLGSNATAVVRHANCRCWWCVNRLTPLAEPVRYLTYI